MKLQSKGHNLELLLRRPHRLQVFLCGVLPQLDAAIVTKDSRRSLAVRHGQHRAVRGQQAARVEQDVSEEDKDDGKGVQAVEQHLRKGE